MSVKDYFAAADRIILADEWLSYEMVKRYFPNYKSCKTVFDFWERYTKIVRKKNCDYYVPFSFLIKISNYESEVAYNYALIRLVDYLTDIDTPVFIGLNFNAYAQFETDIIKVAEYLTRTNELRIFDEKYIMRIRYRQDFNNIQNVYIVEENDTLTAKVENCIDNIAEFHYEIIINDFQIPKGLSQQVVDCINTSFRKYVLSTTIGEDDRCFLDNAFSIYVPEQILDLPKKRWGYNPIEYFYAGHKSKFAPFNDLLSFIYDSISDCERKLFPYKQ